VQSAGALIAAAATIGVVHTLLGPDHYVPFVALARSRAWSLRRALGVTALCGVGHVVGSIALGALGVGFGWALGGLVEIEAWRGTVAGWLLLGVGIAYTAWGIRRALRKRPHEHLHAHDQGLVHKHGHDHHGAHAHPHFAGVGKWLGPWSIFVVFVLGPCEPLIPILMFPAASGSWMTVVAVAGVFALTTIGTMTAVVAVGALGLSKLPAARLARWSHAFAGAALALCGIAVTLGL
jgi:ABC-type nickel/cobalt efflux system permease component RcnA